MLLETRFAKLPDDMDESIFTSSAGKTIYRRLLELDDNTDYVDIGRIEDGLDEKTMEQFEIIKEKIIPRGREDIIFSECIGRIRKRELKKREAKIIMQLSMADEEENRNDIIKLTEQLMEIQKKIRE